MQFPIVRRYPAAARESLRLLGRGGRAGNVGDGNVGDGNDGGDVSGTAPRPPSGA